MTSNYLSISVDKTVCFNAWKLDRLPLLPAVGGVVDQAHRRERRDRSRADTVLEKGKMREIMVTIIGSKKKEGERWRRR